MEYCYIVRCRMIQNTLLVIKLLIKIHNYEYVMEDLKGIKRNNWVAKHPDIEQSISAAFGGILSKMAGGSRYTGAYISRMGNALDGVNGFYLYYEDNISNDVKNIFLIQQLS